MTKTEAVAELQTSASGDRSTIVLFDGVCNFCNAWVKFIIPRDPCARFRFAALQSEVGRKLLEQHGLPVDALDTLVVIESRRAFTHSTAALRIARRLSFAWPALYYAAIWIPRPLRDALYTGFARRRYRWFGRSETCPLPPPGIARRFIDVPDTY